MKVTVLWNGGANTIDVLLLDVYIPLPVLGKPAREEKISVQLSVLVSVPLLNMSSFKSSLMTPITRVIRPVLMCN